MGVSVVIPVKNGARFIVEAIQSALGQPETEAVVVVDDGSTDATAERVAAIVDPRLRWVGGPARGVSAARNRGFAEVAENAEWALFLDADDRLRPGALAALLAAATPEAVAVYGGYERIDEAGRSAGRRRWLAGRLKPSGDILRPLLAGNFIVNGGVLIVRAPAWREVGDFDETLRYCEDWRAFCRLAVLGPILYTPATVLDYRVHAESAMMREAIPYSQYQPALTRVFADPDIARRLKPGEAPTLAAAAEAHLRAYLACQAVRSGGLWRALPQAARAVRASPRRAPRTAMHVLGAAAGL